MTASRQDITVAWHISTYSQNADANCVEAGPIRDADRVAIRDSTRRTAGTFTTSRTAWSDFTTWAATFG